jgi:Tol biopolymer transport system component
MLLAAALAAFAAAAVLLISQVTRPWFGKSTSGWENASFTQVTHDPGVEWFATLSPNGEIVAYAARGDIYLLRLGGTQSVNLTGDSPAVDTQPAFSPDGRLIAFRSERDGGGIYVMEATGESVRRLTDFGFHPSWSPDGQEIVLGIENIVNPLAGSTEAPAWAVTVATGNKRQLGNGDAAQPTWSPHNRRIAFWTHNGAAQQPAQRDVWTMRTDGSDRG